MDNYQLSKLFSGELAPEEKEALLASLDADEAELEEATKLKNIWAAAQLTIAPADKQTAHIGWEKFQANINRQKHRIWSWQRIAAAAVLTGIIFAASFFAGHQIYQNKYAEATYHTVSVPAGQYIQLTLADGSEIWLNSHSKLTYPERFTSKIREIHLEGEGLFKVVSNVKRPFIVKTDKLDVIATGTQFNVSAYPDENSVSATLIEGIIKLHSAANGIDFEINAGQIAVYDKLTQQISAHDTDTDMQTAWIHGEYSFIDMSLEEIAKRFERIYDVVFVYHDETLKQRKFTGTFYNHQSIENIMQIIQISGNMQYTIENDTIYIK